MNDYTKIGSLLITKTTLNIKTKPVRVDPMPQRMQKIKMQSSHCVLTPDWDSPSNIQDIRRVKLCNQYDLHVSVVLYNNNGAFARIAQLLSVVTLTVVNVNKSMMKNIYNHFKQDTYYRKLLLLNNLCGIIHITIIRLTTLMFSSKKVLT